MLKFIKIGKKVLKIVGFLVLLTVLVIVMRKLLMNAASDFEVAVYKMSDQIPNLKSISITDAEGEMIDEITLRVGEKKELSISFSLERESIEGVESLSAEGKQDSLIVRVIQEKS